jgi:hypothetical protein
MDGSSWRKVSDEQVEDYYLQCMNEKKDHDTCDAQRDENRDELYSGIPWGGIAFLAIAPVAVIWAGGFAVWFVRRKLKSKPANRSPLCHCDLSDRHAEGVINSRGAPRIGWPVRSSCRTP